MTASPPARLAHVLRRRVIGPIARSLLHLVVRVIQPRGQRRISAVVRVRNEEEFLERAVRSLVDLVDEVVIVDNLSSDGTPAIISSLKQAHPDKIRGLSYRVGLARYGTENAELGSTWRGRRSRRLLANFYNWGDRRCRFDFILKWDGDMIATSELARVLAQFRSSPQQVRWLFGANLHRGGTRLVAGRAFEDSEPRLYSRRLARYTNGLRYCERLWSPYIYLFPQYSDAWEVPVYVHMKFCKTDRFSNMSPDQQELAEAQDVSGRPLEPPLAATVADWGLAPGAPAAFLAG